MIVKFLTEVKKFFTDYETYLKDVNSKLAYAQAETRGLSAEINLIYLKNITHILQKVTLFLENPEIEQPGNIKNALEKARSYLLRANEVLLLEQKAVVIADEYIRPKGMAIPIHAHKANREAIDQLLTNINAVFEHPMLKYYIAAKIIDVDIKEKTWMTTDIKSALSYRILDLAKYLLSNKDSLILTQKGLDISNNELALLDNIKIDDANNSCVTKKSKNNPLSLSFTLFIEKSGTLKQSAEKNNIEIEGLSDILKTVDVKKSDGFKLFS